MGLIHRNKRKMSNDESGAIFTIAAIIIVAGAALMGTYFITKPIGEGIGSAFTIFGQEIGLYATVGLTLLGMIFLWLVFGRKD